MATWRTPDATNLGIAMTGGLPVRRVAADHLLRARLAKQKQRKNRLQRFARINRPGASKIYKQGVVPAVHYGSQVWGYSGADLRDLQSFFLSSIAPPGKGKSRSLALLLWDDFSWKPALAPVIAYINVVWQALVSPGIAVVPLATLARWFKAADRRCKPRNWGEVCGPYSAMWLSLRRIG